VVPEVAVIAAFACVLVTVAAGRGARAIGIATAVAAVVRPVVASLVGRDDAVAARALAGRLAELEVVQR